MAEKTTIPGFVDNNYIDDDQVMKTCIATVLPLARLRLYCRKLAKGMKKGAIAKAISKSLPS